MSAPRFDVLPCNRGMAGGTTRGLHHFQAGVGGKVCCVYCGATPALNVTVTYGDSTASGGTMTRCICPPNIIGSVPGCPEHRIYDGGI